MRLKRKVKEWLKRYLPAEIISIAATLVAGIWAHNCNYGLLGTALAGTWAGTLAYYTYIFIVDFRKSIDLHTLQGRLYTNKSLGKDLRALAAEFGIAEVVDSLLLRPAFMYYIPLLMGHLVSGILVAKLCGDITFYIPAIIGYELNKRYRRKTQASQ
ncbi:MAG: hypothetical protein JWQ38_638 [Flavipsychrobacter sp.]|nr:hypothetical protein [Flavipsychrobacter sp.]